MNEDGVVITYTHDVRSIRLGDLDGFFVGWPTAPTPERLQAALSGSTAAGFAWNGLTLVGFVYAISDGALSAFIPLLEVTPDFQAQGVGSDLVRRLLARLQDYYMVDVVCDETVAPFYEQLGGTRLTAVGWRHRAALAR